MHISIRALLGAVTLGAVATLSASCSQTPPLSPADSSGAALQQAGKAPNGSASAAAPGAVTTSADALEWPLVSGSFAAEGEKGDRLVGTYTGMTQFSDTGLQTSSITLHISSGSGAFAGATATLNLYGVGAFIGEGTFLLNGRSELSLAGGKRSALVLSLQGISTVTCDAGRVLISQAAGGTLTHTGRITATLNHQAGNADCSS